MNDTTTPREEQQNRPTGARSSNRRVTLELLAASPDGVCTVDDLVAAAAERDGDDPSDAAVRDGVRLRLYHVDLPVLASAGLVDYDWHSGDVVFADPITPPGDDAADRDADQPPSSAA